MALTLQRARPFTVTSPEPMIVASTSPSEAKAALPDPAMVTLTVSAFKASIAAEPLPAMVRSSRRTLPAAR